MLDVISPGGMRWLSELGLEGHPMVLAERLACGRVSVKTMKRVIYWADPHAHYMESAGIKKTMDDALAAQKKLFETYQKVAAAHGMVLLREKQPKAPKGAAATVILELMRDRLRVNHVKDVAKSMSDTKLAIYSLKFGNGKKARDSLPAWRKVSDVLALQWAKPLVDAAAAADIGSFEIEEDCGGGQADLDLFDEFPALKEAPTVFSPSLTVLQISESCFTPRWPMALFHQQQCRSGFTAWLSTDRGLLKHSVLR